MWTVTARRQYERLGGRYTPLHAQSSKPPAQTTDTEFGSPGVVTVHAAIARLVAHSSRGYGWNALGRTAIELYPRISQMTAASIGRQRVVSYCRHWVNGDGAADCGRTRRVKLGSGRNGSNSTAR